MREFTKNERIYIVLCLDFYERKKKVRWHDLNDEGLGKSTIKRITERFRELNYIKNDSYDINKKKLSEIKERLKFPIEIEIKQHRILQRIPEFKDLFMTTIIILVIGLLSLYTFNFTGITGYPKAHQTNETNNTLLKIPFDKGLSIGVASPSKEVCLYRCFNRTIEKKDEYLCSYYCNEYIFNSSLEES